MAKLVVVELLPADQAGHLIRVRGELVTLNDAKVVVKKANGYHVTIPWHRVHVVGEEG